MDLRDLYQDIILDHARRPRNFRAPNNHSHHADGHNPLCGDQISIFLQIDDQRIAGVSFQGHGCAISTASASLMTEILTGLTLAEAEAMFHAFHLLVTEGTAMAVAPELEDAAERLEPLAGVRAYPARVKCATLAWHTFDAALHGGTRDSVKTE